MSQGGIIFRVVFVDDEYYRVFASKEATLDKAMAELDLRVRQESGRLPRAFVMRMLPLIETRRTGRDKLGVQLLATDVSYGELAALRKRWERQFAGKLEPGDEKLLTTAQLEQRKRTDALMSRAAT